MAKQQVKRVQAPAEEADARAREIEEQMTDDERFSLIVSLIGPVPSIKVPRDPRIPEDVKNVSAGYTPSIPRLGIPAIQSSDASLGVTNPGYRPDDKGATAFPALVALGSSFNPKLGREGGEAIGREARIRGFNVQLAGGINLARDPRNGRNFEILLRGSVSQRRSRRRAGQRHPEPGRRFDAQALHAKLQRNQPPLAGRDHRPRRASRVGPARLSDRDRALAGRLNHDQLQQGQR
jgi:hypothetical protein